MRYLLDTNAWLRWFHRPDEICSNTTQVLNGEQIVALSPMSIIEVAQKVSKGKLALSLPVDVWVKQSLPTGKVELLPVSVDVALAAYSWIDDFHGDPADRIIAATAKVHRLTLVTSDQQLLGRSDVRTLSTR